MHNHVFLRCTTATTSMLHENRNRKQLQILAKRSGSCSHAAQQSVDKAYSVKKNLMKSGVLYT